MILSSKRKKKQLKLWTLRRNWYRLSVYYFSGKRRSLLHPNTVKNSFFVLQSYSWKTFRKIAPKKRASKLSECIGWCSCRPRHPIILLKSN